MLKFYWNGIKDNGGALQTCQYSDAQLINFPLGTISIYKKEYSAFSDGIQKAFTVTNDSEMQSDYIVSDVIRVMPTHPLYSQVVDAMQQKKTHDTKRWAKRMDRLNDTRTPVQKDAAGFAYPNPSQVD